MKKAIVGLLAAGMLLLSACSENNHYHSHVYHHYSYHPVHVVHHVVVHHVVVHNVVHHSVVHYVSRPSVSLRKH